MAATLPVLNSIQQHLQEHLPDWHIELMPDQANDYHLSHPNGAVLISYAGSKFDNVRPTHLITQSRRLHIVLTVMCRHLHDDFGAIALLDELRLLMVGFCPPSCDGCFLLEEHFDGTDAGIWQYQLLLQTNTVQVERHHIESKPTFQEAIARHQGDKLDSRLTNKHLPKN